MNSRVITLSASLMGLFFAINIISWVSPIKITNLMVSALFGLFWGYFKMRQNIGFQIGRIVLTLLSGISQLVKVESLLNLEFEAAEQFLLYLNRIYDIPLNGMDYRFVTEIRPYINYVNISKLFILWVTVHYLIFPYLFYRYFKRIGIYNRLPKF